MRVIAVLALGFLTGCVLHSAKPVFSDAEAVPVFGAAPLKFAGFQVKDGAWVKMDPAEVTLTPQGRHYLMPDPEHPDDPVQDSYYFVPLDTSHFVIQAVSKGEAEFAVGAWDGKEMLVSALDCEALKASGKAGKMVTFKDDNCELETRGGSAMKVLTKLANLAPPASLKFVKE